MYIADDKEFIEMLRVLREMYQAEVIDLVRCKDCKFADISEEKNKVVGCVWLQTENVRDDFFCAEGQR